MTTFLIIAKNQSEFIKSYWSICPTTRLELFFGIFKKLISKPIIIILENSALKQEDLN